MGTIFDQPSMLGYLADAIDVWPTVRKHYEFDAARSAKITSALHASERGDYAAAADLLHDVVKQRDQARPQSGAPSADLDNAQDDQDADIEDDQDDQYEDDDLDIGKVYNPQQPRDEHGRWSTREGAALAESTARTATRISNIVREVDAAVASLRQVRGGNHAHVVRLGLALHSLQRELRALPGDLHHTAHATVKAARRAVSRARAYVRLLRRQLRDRGIGKALDGQDDAADARRRLKRLRRNIAALRGGLSMSNGLQPMQPLEKSTREPQHLRAFLLKQKIARLKQELAI
jgi:hypothetical protein